MELAYSGLHQLCAPLLDHLDELPVPQRDALATVFGLSTGPAPDRFLVGLAALTLVAQAADQQPLACIIDDAQWLDGASAQLFGFVARRLLAERVALVCAARAGIGDGVLAGLPALEIGGLSAGDARPLLLRHVHGPLDAAVTDQIIAESHGNPLALLELPRRGDPHLAARSGSPPRYPRGRCPALGLAHPGASTATWDAEGALAIYEWQAQLVRDAARLPSCRSTFTRWHWKGRGTVTSRAPVCSLRRATAWRPRPGARSRPSRCSGSGHCKGGRARPSR